MASDAPSRGTAVFTWLVLALTVLPLVWGAIAYGASLDIQQRFWNDIFARFGGPKTFRFFLQPTMAVVAAIHEGVKDIDPSSGPHGCIHQSRRAGQLTGLVRRFPIH